MVDEKDVRRVAAESGLDVRTVRRWFAGYRPRSEATTAAIGVACIKLHVKIPPRKSKQKKGRAA